MLKSQMMTLDERTSESVGELICSVHEQLFVSIYPEFCDGIQTSNFI